MAILLRIPNGVWAKIERGALSGAGEWSHNWANPAATTCSEDTKVAYPVKMLWFGQPDPRYIIDRHHRPGCSLYKKGHLVVPGLHRVMAVDAYNGVRLWDIAVPNSGRVGVLKDAGWVVLASDYVYAAASDDCVGLDAETGRPTLFFAAPQAISGETLDWGYLCSRDANNGTGGWTRSPTRPAQGYLLSAGNNLFVPAGKFSPVMYSMSNGSGGSAIGVEGCYALIVDGGSLANGPGYGGSRSYINDPGSAIARVDGNFLIVNGGYSYFCNDTQLVKLTRNTGGVVWSVPSPYRYSLIMAGDTLYAGGDDEAAAFNSATGEKIWSGPVNGRACGLAVANGSLYVSTDLGSVHCFRDYDRADLNRDGVVNGLDLGWMAPDWLDCTHPDDKILCGDVTQ